LNNRLQERKRRSNMMQDGNIYSLLPVIVRQLEEIKAILKKESPLIGARYNTECPNCGLVFEGFDTKEEAATWDCTHCSSDD
jgi:hypothetical protein